MRKEVVGKVANVRNRSSTVAIEVCLSFNFFVFGFNISPVLPRKAQFFC